MSHFFLLLKAAFHALGANDRITEDGQARITEDGVQREVE